jgi:hypothetical protein
VCVIAEQSIGRLFLSGGLAVATATREYCC